MILNSQIHAKSGVTISKEEIFVGDKVTISYDGLLMRSGADKIIAHIGYGEEWDKKEFIPMDLVNGMFRATFKISKLKDLNISFKDSADNWDNNSTNNYTFKVSDKVVKKQDKQVKKAVTKTETKKEVEKTNKKTEPVKAKKSEISLEKVKKEVKKKA